MKHIYDIIIIGGGPGGYTAALYGARAGFDTIVLEKLSAGGQMALTSQIDNYPGVAEGIDGFTLGLKMKENAENAGAKTILGEVHSVNLLSDPKVVEYDSGTLYGRTVIIATGATHRELGIPGEKGLIGKGLHYCATCDGMFYRDKTVAVIGGGNTAAADALYLSRISKKVILIHRRDTLRATRIYHEPLFNAENVEFRWNSTVSDFITDEKITGIRLKDVHTGSESVIECDGVFVSIGRKPATELVKNQLLLDSSGYIIADESTATNIPGVFAVGDVRTKPLRQIVTATADGAAAIQAAEEYLAVGAVK